MLCNARRRAAVLFGRARRPRTPGRKARVLDGGLAGAQTGRLRLVDDARQSERDAIVAARSLRREQAVGDVVAYPRRIARERVAIAASSRANTNKSLAGADLHVRHFRREHLCRPVSPDEPQLGRTTRLAASEPPGDEFLAFAFDRSATIA